MVIPLTRSRSRSFVRLRVKSIRANLDVSNLELWSLDHWYPPFSLSSMFLRIEWVSSKVLPIAMNAMSSTKASVSSELPSAVSTRSELYMMNRSIEKGSPCPIPLVIGNQSDRKSSNHSLVFLPLSRFSVKFTIVGGRRRVRILWRSQSVTVFGNTPSMLRNRADTTFPCLHACRIVVSRRWSESVVERPGLPPKWVLGRRWCVSSM